MSGQIWDTRYVPSIERYRDPNWHCRIVTVYEGSFHTMRRIWEAEEANRRESHEDHALRRRLR